MLCFGTIGLAVATSEQDDRCDMGRYLSDRAWEDGDRLFPAIIQRPL